MKDLTVRKANNRVEADIKYDAVLIYGDPEFILKGNLEDDILPDKLIEHYRIIASIKTGKFNNFKNFKEQKRLMSLIYNNDRYLTEEESMRLLETLGLTEKLDYQEVEKAIKDDVETFLDDMYKEISEK